MVSARAHPAKGASKTRAFPSVTDAWAEVAGSWLAQMGRRPSTFPNPAKKPKKAWSMDCVLPPVGTRLWPCFQAQPHPWTTRVPFAMSVPCLSSKRQRRAS